MEKEKLDKPLAKDGIDSYLAHTIEGSGRLITDIYRNYAQMLAMGKMSLEEAKSQAIKEITEETEKYFTSIEKDR